MNRRLGIGAAVWLLMLVAVVGGTPAEAASVTATSWVELDGSGTLDGLSRNATGVRTLEHDGVILHGLLGGLFVDLTAWEVFFVSVALLGTAWTLMFGLIVLGVVRMYGGSPSRCAPSLCSPGVAPRGV